MAFFTDWLTKIGSLFQPTKQVNPVALVLSKSDGSPDMAQSDGSGSLMVNLAAGEGLATSAKQDSQITQETEINAHVHSIDGKVTACNTGAVTVASSALPAGAAKEDRQTSTTCVSVAAKTAPATPAAATAIAATTAAKCGVLVSADLTNGGTISLGGSGVAIGTGVELQAGDSVFLPVSDPALVFCVGSAAAQVLRVVVL